MLLCNECIAEVHRSSGVDLASAIKDPRDCELCKGPGPCVGIHSSESFYRFGPTSGNKGWYKFRGT